MPFYVIAGWDRCPKFVHAIEIANYLQERLPDFEVFKITKLKEDWNLWLLTLNKSKGWHMHSSPVIWKEISMRGGHPYLIGGLSEFWEYIWDYYGLKSTLTKKDINSILKHHERLQDHNEEQKSPECQATTNNIGITGASNPMFPYLLLELKKLNSLVNLNTVIKVYDNCFDTESEKAEEIFDIVRELQPLFNDGRKDNLIVVRKLDKILRQCDLLLVLNEIERNPKETEDDYFLRCDKEMSYLGERINTYAKRTIRIILSHYGPICFNASILLKRCTSIKLSNIVAVTSDIGLPFVTVVSERVKIPVKNIGGPPVWGFLGYNSYIDIKRMITKTSVLKPFERATKDIPNSTLSNGVTFEELRMTSSIITDEIGIFKEVEKNRQKIHSCIGRKPLWGKLRATVHLLTTWFSQHSSDEIISLGVCSDGTFGIPPGLIFSQPVKLNKKNTWKPYLIPVPDHTLKKVVGLAVQAQKLMTKHKDVPFTPPQSEQLEEPKPQVPPESSLTPDEPASAESSDDDDDDDKEIYSINLNQSEVKPSSKIKSFINSN